MKVTIWGFCLFNKLKRFYPNIKSLYTNLLWNMSNDIVISLRTFYRGALSLVPKRVVLLFPRALQKCQNYLWSGFYFPNQIVSDFRILKSGQRRYEIFVSFFDVKGLSWPLYKPHISCNAIAGVVWTVNNDHDTKNIPTKLRKFEENSKKMKEKRWSEEWRNLLNMQAYL